MKYKCRFEVIEAIPFIYTPTGIAELAAFVGNLFQGVLEEPNSRGQMVARVGGLHVTEGNVVYRRPNGKLGVLNAVAFSILFGKLQSEPVVTTTATPPKMLDLETAMQAALAKAAPTPAPVEEPKLNIKDSAKVAFDAGLATFTHHTPCKEGHVERYANGGGCVECNRQYQATYVKRERRKAQNRAASKRLYDKKKAVQTLSSPAARWLAPLVLLPQ